MHIIYGSQAFSALFSACLGISAGIPAYRSDMDLYSTVTKIAQGSAVYALHAIFLHEARIRSLEIRMMLFKAEVLDVFSQTRETCLRP